MSGHAAGGLVRAHETSRAVVGAGALVRREQREAEERGRLRPGSALAVGAGLRAIPEEPDDERTCFERDRDRIVHSTAFRRLAGKTQVVVYPSDHQRTRLTHALEVAQVATAIARAAGVNVTLAEAIALGHDCGHGPGGHASEDAFDAFLPDGFDHGPWGADVVLAPLNLCAETLDGIRNHSWSRPAPATVEGEIVSWADRIAYCAHDLEDAVHAGCAAIALHGRTAQQAYSGEADWHAISALKESVAIPVLGNGDIWEAEDARRMMAETGCDGVVVGRGCLGRPWLFADLAAAFTGRGGRQLPSLGMVADTLRRHAELLAGLSDEPHGCAELRKHIAWYFKGFPVGGELRRALSMVSSLDELDSLLARLDRHAAFPATELGMPRGRQGAPRDRVALPEGWLDDTSGADLDLSAAEVWISGG